MIAKTETDGFSKTIWVTVIAAKGFIRDVRLFRSMAEADRYLLDEARKEGFEGSKSELIEWAHGHESLDFYIGVFSEDGHLLYSSLGEKTDEG